MQMWRLQHTQKKLGHRQNKAEKVTSNTVLEGSTISSLTGNRWGSQDWLGACQDLGQEHVRIWVCLVILLCYSVLFIFVVLVVLSLLFILCVLSIFLSVPRHCVLERLVFTVVFLVRVSYLYSLPLASRHVIVSFKLLILPQFSPVHVLVCDSPHKRITCHLRDLG